VRAGGFLQGSLRHEQKNAPERSNSPSPEREKRICCLKRQVLVQMETGVDGSVLQGGEVTVQSYCAVTVGNGTGMMR
jgi:hypothetical protein